MMDIAHANQMGALMAAQLLATKLFIRPPRPGWVPRPRLIDRLNAGLTRKLTLISAPAGFGKTSLLSDWAARSERPVAWLTLDDDDNDPLRFLTYINAAVRKSGSGLVDIGAPAVQSTPRPSSAFLLTTLINEIAATPEPLVLVLDDFHRISDRHVHEAMHFLITYQPANLHLAVATRVDPPWPLPRLRARAEITELRAADLRFTPEESATFLREAMALNLSPDQARMLDNRVEGWVAGLQMAALSLRGRKDPDRFVRAFTGSNRFILDFLVDEVLDQQPAAIQDFLLSTSILDRLTGQLCDAVTGQGGSQDMIIELDQANLFVVPLDDDRRWYRYHRLFADLLRQRLQQKWPELVPDVHRRASLWYEENGLLPEALAHAVTTNDVLRVARLAEGNVLGLLEQGEIGALASWLRALPDEIIHSWPWLNVACAWALAHAGNFDDAGACLEHLESELLPRTAPADPDHLAGHVNAIRLYIHSLTDGGLVRADTYAGHALKLLPPTDVRTRSLVAVLHGLVQRQNHDYKAATANLNQALALSKQANEQYATVDLLCQIARVESQQGALRRAARTCRQAIRLAELDAGSRPQTLPVASYAYASLAEILREWNDLEAAKQRAETAAELSRRWGQFDSWMGSQLLLARIHLSCGAPDEALEVVRRAKMATADSPAWTEMTETFIRLAMGDLAFAVRWRDDRNLSFHRDPSWSCLRENLMLARIELAEFQHGALASLDALIKQLRYMQAQLEQVDMTRGLIGVLVLQARAYQQSGKSDKALAALTPALRLGEPERYVRSFIDEGPPIGQLIKQAALQGIAPGYVSELLAALDSEAATEPAMPEAGMALGPNSARLIEPLSPRELEVLRLLATPLTSTEIAAQLYIAPSTVRSHIKSIYGKLDVHKRLEAIQRAEDLSLL